LGGPVLMPSSQRGPNAWINPAAFAPAPEGAYGNAGVGTVPGPGFQSYDLSFGKHFRLTERFDLKFQADCFNIFNNVNFASLSTTETSGGFGTISTAYPPRNIQLGLRLAF
jgi:hypothetical protein